MVARRNPSHNVFQQCSHSRCGRSLLPQREDVSKQIQNEKQKGPPTMHGMSELMPKSDNLVPFQFREPRLENIANNDRDRSLVQSFPRL